MTTDGDENGYFIYRNNELIKQVPPSIIWFDDHNRPYGVTTTYVVRPILNNLAGDPAPVFITCN